MQLDGLTHVRSGKVRDIHAVDDDHLVLVASDRVSTYDVVLPTPIPDKGKVLTGVSDFWFRELDEVVDNHLVTTRLEDMPAAVQEHAHVLRGRTMYVRKLDIIPFECVVRGYLAGSGWAEYQRHGAVCGVELPDGLQQASGLPEPIFTPATKAEHGEHDENVSFDVVADALGEGLATTLRDTSIELYSRARQLAERRGVVLADTKFEFGLRDGEVVLADEVLTPDSSRYWPAERWEPGSNPPSFDKQFVRDYATSTGWDKTDPGPELPSDVVQATREKYVEAYERITGHSFSAWLAR